MPLHHLHCHAIIYRSASIPEIVFILSNTLNLLHKMLQNIVPDIIAVEGIVPFITLKKCTHWKI